MDYIDLTEQQGGGSGGTSNYNELTNKPQINGVTLTGNKSSTDLGIFLPDGYTITVATDGSGDFTSIQSALDSLQNKVSTGTVTISLKTNNTFSVSETLTIPKDTNISAIVITTTSTNPATVQTTKSGFSIDKNINTNLVVFENVKIVGGGTGYGIYVKGHTNVLANNCDISSIGAGFCAEQGGYLRAFNCKTNTSTQGFLCNNANMLINGCSISNATNGIQWLNQAILQSTSNTFTNVSNQYIATINAITNRGVCYA